MLTCSYDFLTEDWNNKSFVLFTFIANYQLPLLIIAAVYFDIVKAVYKHETVMREQAKKMNVETLRSSSKGNDKEASAEMRITKVAITNCLMWTVAWTPYAVVSMMACFGNRMLVTPLAAQSCAFFAKTCSSLNPMVYAFSHPTYRDVLYTRFPSLGTPSKDINLKGSDGATTRTET